MSESLLLSVGVPLGLFIIMFGLGSTLTRDDLMASLKDRYALAAGLGAQLVLLPVVGMLIALLAPIPVEFKFGILILACCPGGTTSNVFTHLAKGNLALSVSLTTISSLMSLITMPLTLALGATLLARQDMMIEIPQGYIIKSLLVITVVPVCLGMLFRHYFPRLAQSVERRISVFSSLFLAALIVVITIKEWQVLYSNLASLGPLLILLSAVSMLLGVGLARLVRTTPEDSVTIGLEAGIQNSGLAIFIALTLMENELMTIPPAIYTVSMYVCASLMIWVGRRQMAQARAGA